MSPFRLSRSLRNPRSRRFTAADDMAALERAKSLHVATIGNGYDLRQGDRLVIAVRRQMAL